MKFEDMINKVINCDCYEMIKNIPDNSVDLVIIDPPYEFTSFKGGTDLGKRNYIKEYKKIYGHGANKDINKIANEINEISNGFDFIILDELERIMKKTNIYIWCSKKQLGKLLNYYESKNYNIDVLTWHKDDPIPMCGNSYLSDTEYCVFAREENVKLYGSVNTKRKYYVSHCNRKDKSLFNHPTIKPLDIIKNLVINSSKENDVVLDCFCGSGTTCVACQETGRKFIGMEISKEYYEIAQKRINGMTAWGQASIFTDFDKLEEEYESRSNQ